MTKIEFEASSGNIFADLGIPEPEEALIQADLALEIGRHIADQGWTQKQAAKALGLQQSDVSNIVRGRLKGFSIERLIKLLRSLGQTVHVVVESHSQAAAQPTVSEISKGSVQISSQLYADAAALAASQGMSLMALVEQAVKKAVERKAERPVPEQHDNGEQLIIATQVVVAQLYRQAASRQDQGYSYQVHRPSAALGIN